jgi:hypothetical protein
MGETVDIGVRMTRVCVGRRLEIGSGDRGIKDVVL